MRAHRLAAVLIASVVLGRSNLAFGVVDVTGSWSLFVEGASPNPTVIDIVQTGNTLTLSSGGVPLPTFLSQIDPQTGAMTVAFIGGNPCPSGFIATASPDGNAFFGYGGQTEPSCPGPVISCFCAFLHPLGIRGCRIGAPGGCCGDGVVAPDEQCDTGPEAYPGTCCSDTCQVTSAGGACTPDANACTVDVCDGAGTCTHEPGPTGVGCLDEGEFCTLDVCDAAGTCTHPPGPAGAPCSDDGDTCTLDVCDASGVCVHSPGPDSDGDGLCDVIDPCTGAPVTHARLKVGADGLAMKGEAILPPTLAVQPVASGIGIRVEVGGGQYFRSILAGAWDEATRTGWKANRAGTAFRYRDPSTRIRLTRVRSDPSRLRIVIDRFDDPPGLPAVVSAARVVIFFPPTIPGQCAEALFPASACQVRGAVLSCR